LYKDKESLESANRLKQQNENHNHTESDDPQIPQPDLRFASGNSEANSKKKTTQPKNGARAQTKTPTESICTWTQWQNHCIAVKSMQKMNYISQLPRQT